MYWTGLEFKHPYFFWFLLLLVPIIVWYILRQNKMNATLQLSSFSSVNKIPRSYKEYLRHILFGFRMIALALLIVALARPQSTDTWKNSTTKGINIVLTLDISTSMLAQDFQPNRLEAAKKYAMEFINGRPNDKLGLVVFAGESFTQCPLTTDQAVMINLMKDVETGIVEDGTAIGMGLANSVVRLKDADGISKVIILLTDGVNNKGDIDPVTAAEIAREFGIRVYTVGVGSEGMAPYPFHVNGRTIMQQVETEIDEDVLKDIARLTGGKYYHATNNDKLLEIYQEIDKLEKTRIKEDHFSKKYEEFLLFALIAGVLLLVEFLLRNILINNVP